MNSQDNRKGPSGGPGSPNNGGSDQGPSNNGNNNNNPVLTDEQRKRNNKKSLQARLESYVADARATRIEAGQNPNTITYGELINESKKSPRPITWTEYELLKEVMEDAGAKRLGKIAAVCSNGRATFTLDRMF